MKTIVQELQSLIDKTSHRIAIAEASGAMKLMPKEIAAEVRNNQALMKRVIGELLMLERYRNESKRWKWW